MGSHSGGGGEEGEEGEEGLRQSLNYLNGRNIFLKLNIMRQKYNDVFTESSFKVGPLIISQCSVRLHNKYLHRT